MSRRKSRKPKKLPRQIKCVKMKSEPLTDKQKAVMEEAMLTRMPILNDFYGRYSGIQSLSFLDARKIRDALKSEKPSEQFGCTTRMWTMALFDVIANIRSAWSNLAGTIKELIRENDGLGDEEKDYLRYVVSSRKIWGDILCGRKVGRPTAAYKDLLADVDESRLKHLHVYLRRITRREKARISHSTSCRTLYLDENMYTFSEAEEDGHNVYFFIKKAKRKGALMFYAFASVKRKKKEKELATVTL